MEVYGIKKIGITEIDLDHTNIDKYLGFALECGFDEDAFGNLCRALISHFEREERICAEQHLNMSDQHKEEHQRLVGVLADLSYADKSEEEWLLFFKSVLMRHVEEFDMEIVKPV